MKHLFSSPNHAEIGLLRSRLQNAGIACEIRNEHVTTVVPTAPFQPELWVVNDDQHREAKELLDAWRKPTVEAPVEWPCRPSEPGDEE